MADLVTDLIRKIESLEKRIEELEHHEFAIMHAGDGAPTHLAAEGVLYWDYGGDDLYINHDGTDAKPIDDKMFAASSGVVKSKFEINGLDPSNVGVLMSPNVRNNVDFPVPDPP